MACRVADSMFLFMYFFWVFILYGLEFRPPSKAKWKSQNFSPLFSRYFANGLRPKWQLDPL
ncbi:hypothetical protein CFP56_019274 [Quercus suber]|uniref:ATP synthase F0 subunit 8 n=1 Tax=Quercus suber TaxID=58331 RepID=A0AAW0KII7_QUESU